MMVTWYVNYEVLRDLTVSKNIPLFPEGSNLFLLSFEMCTNTGRKNILRWLTFGFFLVNISSRVLNPSALWVIYFGHKLLFLLLHPISALEYLDRESYSLLLP
jgi:hypothetical protein